MTDRIEAAIKNYRNHYNCSQSILCAWADKLNMNDKTSGVDINQVVKQSGQKRV